MANETIMQEQGGTLLNGYAMEGGDGPTSYAKNSAFQLMLADRAKDLIREAIADNLDLESMFSVSLLRPKNFLVADLGCSTGPNTFVSVQNIIEAIELGHPSLHQSLTFQVFFNDHVSNDFNTLFKTIPPSTRYYAAGVPGSFHGRLFPAASLHIAHSIFSLHWMSKVPEGITNKGSIIWNGDAGSGVAEAYLAQYTKDMGSFLNSRATELVVGGLLIMCLTVRPNGVILNGTAFTFDQIGSCLVDMAKEGIILERDVDSFNMPIYFPTVEELEKIIKKNELFTVEKMEWIDHRQKEILFTSEMVASGLKAVFGTLLGEHFGSHIMDEVFERFQQKFEQNIQYSRTLDLADMFILLKRKD